MRNLLIVTVCLSALCFVSTIAVTGYEGGEVSIRCNYSQGDENNRKYLCRGATFTSCEDLIRTGKKNTWVEQGRFSLYDNTGGRFFTVNITHLTQEDAETYWCGIDRTAAFDHSTRVQLTVVKGETGDPHTGECKGKSVEQCQLDYVLNSSTSLVLPPKRVETLLNEVLGNLTQEDGEVGEKERDLVLEYTEKLVSALVNSTQNQSRTNIISQQIEVQTFAIGPEADLKETPQLKAKENLLNIDLLGIAKNNNGFGAVAFTAYTNMGDLLKARLFHTKTDTIKTMMSSVVSASLPKTKNTALPKPVNFTLRHLTQVDPQGQLTCVYWNESRWIVDGCEATETNATHTVCTCVHLSTFALIMQTDKPPEDDRILKLINSIAVSVGLLFLALAILTFICCRWNPRINNTARLHLSICLFLAHLLFLLVQSFLHHIRPHEVVCAILSGVLHFLFLSSFVWMFLEALQLFLLVRNLREVKAIQRDGIHWRYLLLIGYGFPCLVVGVSAGLVPKGYGSNRCWLETDKGFRWSFLGPVCFILTMNVILFITIIGHLRFTLAGLNKDVSRLKDTRMMVFKAVIQFFILGCPWILGFFLNNNKFLEFLFIVSTSQQGTFIFLVHCVLKKEVREQYRRWWKILKSSSDASDSCQTSRTFMNSQSVATPEVSQSHSTVIRMAKERGLYPSAKQ